MRRRRFRRFSPAREGSVCPGIDRATGPIVRFIRVRARETPSVSIRGCVTSGSFPPMREVHATVDPNRSRTRFILARGARGLSIRLWSALACPRARGLRVHTPVSRRSRNGSWSCAGRGLLLTICRSTDRRVLGIEWLCLVQRISSSSRYVSWPASSSMLAGHPCVGGRHLCRTPGRATADHALRVGPSACGSFRALRVLMQSRPRLRRYPCWAIR